MAKRVAVPYQDTKLRVVGPKGYFDAYRIQRLDMPTNIPNTVINELGNAGHAGVVTDVPECTATFQAFDVSHKIFSILTGYNYVGYPATGVDVSSLSSCDLITYIKQDNVNQHLKCMHVKYARCTDFTFTYSADGESTEEYTFGGSEKRYTVNDIVVDSGGLSATRTFTVTQTPKELRSGNKFLSFIVNGSWLEEGTQYSVAGSTATVSGGYGSSGNVAIAVYHTASGYEMPWTGISDSTVPAAIRGKNIPVYIYATDGTKERQYRVQSVNIRGTFPSTPIKEMGSTSIVGYITEPPDITGDISVLDVDNEIIALLTTGAKTGDSYEEYGVDRYDTQTLKLKVEVKNPSNNTTILKTVEIPAMKITSDGTTSNVGGQLTQTFGFMSNDGRCIVYSGSS